jgi:hypothetical protein
MVFVRMRERERLESAHSVAKQRFTKRRRVGTGVDQ